MRAAGVENNDIDRIQAWAGQSAAMALALPAAEVVAQLWKGAREILEWQW
jgi:nitronate monooxygenase